MSLAAETNLIARDTAIPGLGMVLNPGRLQKILQQRLPDKPLGDLQATYLRYKPGMNCLATYRLQLEDEWVYFHAKAFHQADVAKLKKWQQRPGLLGSLGFGRQVLPFIATQLSEFPNDAKLRGLPYLTQLEDSVKHRQTLFPNRSPQSGQLLPLRYKPERRYVAQWVGEGQPQALVKAYAAKGFTTASQNIHSLQSCGGLRLAQPLAQSRYRGIISYEWLPGKSLTSLLSAPEGQGSDLEAVGNALGMLHQQILTRKVTGSNLAHIKIVFALVDWLNFLLPPLATLTRQIGDYFVQYLSQMPRCYQAIHGDFYADQVVVMADAIAILDLDCATLGDPMVDLGNFKAHLERQCLQGDLSYGQIEQIQAHLLTGYRAASRFKSGFKSRLNSEARLSLYTALGLFCLAPAPFRYRDPRWPDKTVQILERVLQLLEQHPTPVFQLAGNRPRK